MGWGGHTGAHPPPRGHPRQPEGLGWDPLPAGCWRKLGRKSLAGAPQHRDTAHGTGGFGGWGDTGVPRSPREVRSDVGHPKAFLPGVQLAGGRAKGEARGLRGLVGSPR